MSFDYNSHVFRKGECSECITAFGLYACATRISDNAEVYVPIGIATNTQHPEHFCYTYKPAEENGDAATTP